MACIVAAAQMAVLFLALSILQAQLISADHILPPEITLHPQPVSVQYGQSAFLTCSAQGHPQPDILWYKDGCSYPINSSTTVTGEDGSITSTLYLSHLATLVQPGSYYCTAYILSENTTAMASTSSNSAAVTVKEPMIAIYLHVAELGNMSITLRWSAFNYSMPITGYNVTVENTASVEDQTTYSVGGDQHELSISSLVYRNTYNFSLLAMDDSGTVHSASPITVVIRQYEFQLLGNCGGHGIIKINDNADQWPDLCNGNGSAWDRLAARQICLQLGYRDAVSAVCCADREPLLDSSCWERNQSSLPEWCSFTNESVCNSTSTAIVSCTHTIEPPSNASISPAAVIADGHAVLFQCLASLTYPSFFEWQHNGAIVLGLNPDTSALTVPGTLATGGEYTCTVSNVGGSSTSNTAYIYVHPRVRSYPDSVSVEEGGDLTLTCAAEGYPQPAIAWFKDGVQLLADVSLITHSLTSVQSILRINSSVLNDAGRYQCHASSTFNVFNMSATAVSEDSTVIVSGTPSRPEPPVLLLSTANSLLLGWTEPRDNGVPITQYIITQETSSIILDVANGTILQANISGLLPNTNYTFTLFAVNDIGPSNESDPVTFQTQKVPSPPTNLTISEATPTSLSIEWGPPLQPNGVILWYEVRYVGLDTLNLVSPSFYNESVIRVNRSSFEVELVELVPYSLYNITVQAATQVGSNDSAVLTARTNESLPSPVVDVMLSVLPRMIDLFWSTPLYPNGVLLAYIISFNGTFTLNSVPAEFYDTVTFQVSVSDSPMASLLELEPYSNYTIALSAINSAGEGNVTEISVMTLEDVPSPPTNLTISEATPTSLSIEWGPPLQPNGVILWYEVRYVGLDTFNLVSPSFYNESVIRVNRSSPEVELVELVPYSLYNITVQAATQVGSSDSAVLTARTNESLPSPVVDVMLSVLPRMIDLFWSTPLYPNGVLLTYIVSFNGTFTLNSVPAEFYDTVTFQVSVSDSPMASLLELEPYSNYTIALTAINSAGEGNVTEISVMTLEDVPSPPTNLTISEATPTSLSIEWGPPLQPNGVILWYEVRYVGLDTLNLVSPSFYNESVIRVNGSSLKVELVELVPYSLYNITVQAATQVGSSDSAVLTARTNESLPSPVVDVMLSVLPRMIDLFWSTPLYPNGVLLTYIISFNGTFTLNSVMAEFYDTVTFQVSVSDSPMASLLELEPYSNYTIALTAINSAGEGNVTEISVMTLEDVPSPPTNLTIFEATPTSLSIEWGPPLQPNGVILWYEVRYVGLDTFNLVSPSFYNESVIRVNRSSLEVELVELVPYSLYNITVQAATQVGSSDSAVITTRTNESLPSPVVNVMLSVLPRMIDVFWSTPLYPNGVLLTYIVSFNGTFTLNSVLAEFYDTVTLQVNVSDSPMASLLELEPYSNYTIALSAINSAGEGNVTEISVMTLEDVPSPPTNLTISEATPTSLSIEWGPPLQPNGVILWYEVRYVGLDTLNLVSPSFYNESVIRVNRSSLEVELVELVPYSLYNITVQTATQVGSIDSAVITTRTNESLPSPVVDVMLSVLPRMIDLFWSTPLYPNGVLLTYIVSFNGTFTLNSVMAEFYDTVTLPINVSNSPMASLLELEPYSNYTIALTAINSAGEGNVTEISVMTLEDVPSSPVHLNISDITPTTFLIQWDPPTHPNGIILSYEVSYTGEHTLNDVPETFYNTTVVTVSPSSTSLELLELEPYSVYNVTVRAVNGAGHGAPSSEMGLLTRTEPFLAELPSNLTEFDITINSFSVEWIEPLDPNGVIASYYVELTAIDGSFLQAQNVSNSTLNVTFYGLEPVIWYNVSVCAWTIGCGENITIDVLTDGIAPNVTRANDLYLMADLDEPFELSFLVLDAAPNISEGVVWWTFTSSKGVMNLSCSSTTAYNFSADCLSVRINQVQGSHGGLYVIVAETRAGIGTSHVFVIVRNAPPSIVTPLPSELSQTYSTNFTLTCSAVADLTAVLVWRYNGVKNPPDSDITTNRTHSILKIKSLAGSNSGTYNCSASNRYGRDSTAVNLTVQAPPTINNFPLRRDVVLGDSLVVTCMAEGIPSPSAVWFKGDVPQDNVTVGANTSTARLNIAQFQEEDEGSYSCIATNSIGSVNKSLQVSIVVRPNITGISLNNGEASIVHNGSAGPVDEFENLSLICSATGKPTPSILWLRDGTVLSSNSRRTITSSNSITNDGKMLTTSTLMVPEVLLADKGTYTCRAVSGNVSPVPGQTAWTFQLDVRPRNECVAWRNPCDRKGTMQCVDGSGDYTCICRTVGFSSYFGKNCSMRKDIRTAPMVTEHPKDQLNVTISSMVTLFCNFSGIPAPTVRWFKDDQATGVEGQYFTIGAIRPEERGAYHCEAQNELADNMIGRAVSRKAEVLIQGLVQFQVNLTLTQRPEQLNMEDVKAVAKQLQLFAAGNTFTASGINGSLHSLEVYNRKNSTLLVTMVAQCCLPPQNFSTQFRLYLEQALQEYSDILKSTPFAIDSVQRHDGCPMNVSQVMMCSSIGPVSWSETEIGDIVSRPCPCGINDSLIKKLMGHRTCGGSYTSGAKWVDPQCNECNFTETRNDLCRLTQVDSPAELALRLTNATNDTTQLEKEDVSASTVLLESVVKQNITDDFDTDYVQMDMLTTMDHIAGVSAEQLLGSQEGSKSSTRVLDLVKLITKRANVSQNSSLEFIGTQLALMVTEMPANSTENGTDLSPLIADQIEKIVNESVAQDASKSGFEGLPSASVYLPEAIFQSIDTSANSSRLALAVYATDSLFQQRRNYTYSIYQDFARVTGTIVSVSIVGEVINSGDLPEDEVVTFEFEKNEIGVERGRNGKCAFWKFDDDDQYGGWNTSGCNVTMETNTSIHCQCDHLTHFCILMDIFPERQPGVPSTPELQEALTVISIIGAVVSIICFIIVSFTYLANKNLRAEAHSRILVNLCLSLTGLYISFIISTIDGVIKIPPLCGTVGALLHYFFLSTFFLMAADAILIYKKLVWIFKPDIPSYVAISGAISWTLPVFLVAFSVAPNYKHYYNDKFCRAYGMPYYIGVLVPFGAVYLFNWVMFTLTMIALVCKPAMNTINTSKFQKWRRSFWVAVGLSVLFGLAWSLGLLASNGIPEVFANIFECGFTLLLAAQGILLFVIYCVTSPEARKFWKQILLSGYRCCRYRSLRTLVTSSRPTQSNKLSSTQPARSNDKLTNLTPASPGYSATTASTLSATNNSKSLSSTAFVSDASVIDNSFTEMMESVQEETKPSRFPRDDTGAPSSDLKKGNTCVAIELQPFVAENSPLIPAITIGSEDPACSPTQIPVSDHSAHQTSAV